MSSRKLKAMQLSARIKRRIFDFLDEGALYPALSLLARYNFTHLTAFPGMSEVSPGAMLDDYLETRAFEARL